MSETTTINYTAERPAGGVSGGLLLLVFLGVLALAIWMMFQFGNSTLVGSGGIVIAVLTCLSMTGFYAIQPNEGVAITLFGNYKGTDRSTGLHWIPFWYGSHKISLRVRNVTSEMLKVNDKRGNPIEIAANVVWRVADSAQALYDVDHYVDFVNIQIETALREVARHYAYDHGENEEPTLRADADAVGDRLRQDLQARVAIAGIAIDQTHLMHLAYAPEIAGAMLRRQQADAVLSARAKIVDGAVSMVENALQQMSEHGVVELDREHKAQMVCSLLVVLCADREVQPIVSAASLHG